jgi:ABC-type Mn2+/Zn2+ transport system permease subunit
MGDRNGVDMKLRAAFLLPAVAVILLLGILAAAFPEFLRPLTFTMPVVLLLALGALFLTERKRRQGDD